MCTGAIFSGNRQIFFGAGSGKGLIKPRHTALIQPLPQRFPGVGRADSPMVNVFVGCSMSDLPSNPIIPMYLCTGFSQNSLVEYEWIHSG